MPVEIIQDKIKEAVKNLYNLDIKDVQVEHPNTESWGDFATNISMLLAKDVKQNPNEIAKTLSYELHAQEFTFTVDKQEYAIFENIYPASPGFINFVLSKEWLHYVLYQIQLDTQNYGSSDFGSGRRVLIEFSQPNPNKPQHIGHARNNFLGSSIANVMKYVGYEVLRANYVNDWGTHICKAMLMYKKYGNGGEPDKQPDHFVGDFYVMYEKEEAENPDIATEVAEMFQKLESGDEETVQLWKKIVGWTIKGWERTYNDQGIEFDIWFYQSNYRDTGKDIVNVALEKGIAEKDETGAVVARLEKYNIPDKVLLRADGTSVYSTQDLQMAKDNIEEYKLDKRVYVVDYRQADYFAQIFKILEILGFDWASHLYHMSYGTVELPEGKMSSRKGLVVNADEVFERLIELEHIEAGDEIKNQEDVVKKIAMAAFKYALLKYEPKSNVVFRDDEVTKFIGNTGPYLLYTRARANSVMEKSDFSFNRDLFTYEASKATTSLSDKELAILKHIYKFPEVVLRSAEELAPNLISSYLFELSQRFNTFYNDIYILSEPDLNLRNFRLLLTKSVFDVLSNGLRLLGIQAPNKM